MKLIPVVPVVLFLLLLSAIGCDKKGPTNPEDAAQTPIPTLTWQGVVGPETGRDCYYLLAAGSKFYTASGRLVPYVTTNDGASWSESADGAPAIYDVTSGSGDLYAATENGVYRSTAGTGPWSRITSAPSGPITVARRGSNVVVGAQGTVHVSTDDGTSWSSHANPSFRFIRVAGSYLVGLTMTSVEVSNTDGRTWSPATGSGWVSQILFYLAVKDSTIYVGCQKGLLVSSDLGQTWTTMNSGIPFFGADQPVYAVAFSGTTLYAATRVGVYVSSNGGQSWSPANSGMPATVVTMLAVNGSTIIANTASGFYRSPLSPVQWTRANSGLKTESLPYLSTVDQTLYAVGHSGLYRSTNGGSLWSEVNGPSGSGYVDDFAALPSGLYLSVSDMFTGSSTMHVSNNAGTTWTSFTLPVSSLFGPGRGYVQHGTNVFCYVFGGGVFRSANNGASWTAVNTGLPDHLHINDLAVSESKMIAAGEGGVYVSSDNGATWSKTLSTSFVGSVSALGSNLIAASDPFYYHSTNGGNTWTNVGTGPAGQAFAMTAMKGSAIIAAVNSVSNVSPRFFASADNGRNWTQVGTGGPIGSIIAMTIMGDQLYVTPVSQSVWSATIR